MHKSTKARAMGDQQTHAHAPCAEGKQQDRAQPRSDLPSHRSRARQTISFPSPRCRRRVCPFWCRGSSGSHHRISVSRMRRRRTGIGGAWVTHEREEQGKGQPEERHGVGERASAVPVMLNSSKRWASFDANLLSCVNFVA